MCAISWIYLHNQQMSELPLDDSFPSPFTARTML